MRLRSPRTLRLLRNFGIAAAIVVIWRVRYGPLGPYYDADVALGGAMALRPFGWKFIYQWGGTHIGSVIPLLATPMVALGVDAGIAAQLAVLISAGVGIALLLDLFERWPFAIAFGVFCAFPAASLADTLCQAWCHIPGALLCFGAEITFLRAAARGPTPWRVGLAVLFAGLTVWAADNALLFLGAHGLLAAAALWRQRRAPTARRLALAGAAGGALAGALILAGKIAGPVVENYYKIATPTAAWEAWHQMPRGVGNLVPAVSPELFRGALILLFVLSALLLLRDLRRPLASVSPLSLVGTGPFLGLVGTCFSRWYIRMHESARYVGLPVLFGLLGLCLLADRMEFRIEERWSVRRWWIQTAAGLAALAIALDFAVTDCWNNRDLLHWPAAVVGLTGDGHGRSSLTRGTIWREKAAAALRMGCDAVVAPYWESFPYFELTQGKVIATPREGFSVRSPELAQEAVHKSAVCVHMEAWPPNYCPPTVRQFGVTLTNPQPVNDRADGRPLWFCRYHGAAPL